MMLVLLTFLTNYDQVRLTMSRYKFNGKESDGETGTQDYGMRIYDPALARFLSVDPITKKYPELTPYQFASNTPIQGSDLDGLELLQRTYNVDGNGKTKLKTTTFIPASDREPGKFGTNITVNTPTSSTSFYNPSPNDKPKANAASDPTPPPPAKPIIEKGIVQEIMDGPNAFGSAMEKIIQPGSSNSFAYEGVTGMDKSADVLDTEAKVLNATGIGAPIGKGISTLALTLHTTHDFLTKSPKEAGKRLGVRLVFMAISSTLGTQLDKLPTPTKEAAKLAKDAVLSEAKKETLETVSPSKKDE